MSIVSISYICLQLLLCTQSCDNACFNLSLNKEKLYDFFALKWSNQFQQPQTHNSYLNNPCVSTTTCKT